MANYVLHYRGDVLESLAAQAEADHLFGPDMHGARYVFVAGQYRPDTGMTTAEFQPWIDPRRRERFHGGDGAHLEDSPVLTGRDDIRKR